LNVGLPGNNVDDKAVFVNFKIYFAGADFKIVRIHQPGGTLQSLVVVSNRNLRLTDLHKWPFMGQTDICGFHIGFETFNPDICVAATANNDRKLSLGNRAFTPLVSYFVKDVQI
jgi:hypothetical protein